MLLRFQRILLLPLGLLRPSWELASLSVGFGEDLAHRMNRLGGVRVTTLPGTVEHTADASAPQWTEYGPAEARALLAEHGADQALIGSLDTLPGGLKIVVRLVDGDGEELWGTEAELRDGQVGEALAALAAALVSGSLGSGGPAGIAYPGSGTSIDAYKRVLTALDPAVDGRVRRTVLEEAVGLDEDSIDAHLLLADVQAQQGEGWRALQGLEELVERFPQASRVWHRYAVALRVEGRRTDSLDAARAVLANDPDGRTLFHAGLFAEAGGDHETATEAYRGAVDRGCIDPSLFDNFGHELARAGSDEQALAYWHAALELDPSRLSLLGEQALALYRLGREDEAEAAFADALGRAISLFSTHACRAHWLQARGLHEEAIDAYSTALEHRSHDPLMLNGRGVSRHLLGDEQAARADFEGALSAVSGRRDAGLSMYIRENLARLDRGALGLDDEAARLLSVGGQKLRDEQPEAAVPILQASLSLDADSWTGWLVLGLAYRELGDWEAAANALSEVVRLVPDHAGALSEHSLALLALGNADEALQRGHQAVDAAPDDPGVLCNLGVVCMECGWLEEARQAFEEAADLDPADPITARCLETLDQKCRDERPWGEGHWGAP